MAIELVTGLPGSGKTLQTIWRTKARAEKEGRAVYYSGISQLTLPWIEWDPERWMDVEAGSIFVIDEAQRLFRPRAKTGEPPEYVKMLETHRHLGIDLVFITQNPMLIDSHVRNLCERHWHVMRKFGTHFATIYEYPTGVRATVANGRGKEGIKHEWKYPKEVFTYYKSAEVHTHKVRVPARVYLLLLMPVLFLLMAWIAWSRLNPDSQAKQVEKASGQPAGAASAPGWSGGGMRASNRGPGAAPLTPAEYVQRFQPRVPGLAYTAPVYDRVTEATQAPYPAACIASASRCVCASQQGTRLEVPDDLCRSIAAGGFFVAWDKPAERAYPLANASTRAPGQVQAAAPAPAPVGSLGGTGYGALVPRDGDAAAAALLSGGVPGDQQDAGRPRANRQAGRS